MAHFIPAADMMRIFHIGNHPVDEKGCEDAEGKRSHGDKSARGRTVSGGKPRSCLGHEFHQRDVDHHACGKTQ